MSDVHIDLGEGGGGVIDGGLEEGPEAIHFDDHLPGVAVVVFDLGQGEAETVPGGDEAAVLRPGEDPGDGAEIVESSFASPARGAGGDGEVFDFLDGRGFAEEFDETGGIDEFAVSFEGGFGEGFHLGAPFGTDGGARDVAGDERGPGDLFEVTVGDVGVVVAFGENFALFGEAQRSAEGIGREREDATGGGAPSPAQ